MLGPGQKNSDSGYESIEEVVSTMGSGLVGFHMKGMSEFLLGIS